MAVRVGSVYCDIVTVSGSLAPQVIAVEVPVPSSRIGCRVAPNVNVRAALPRWSRRWFHGSCRRERQFVAHHFAATSRIANFADAGALAIALELHRGPPVLHIAAIRTQGNLMRHFNTDLYAVVFSIVIAFAFLSAATAAPKLSEADDAAIKSAIASCKAEAKAKKIGFTSRRAFLRDCVTETIKNNPPKR
jgi:hypothetical protein